MFGFGNSGKAADQATVDRLVAACRAELASMRNAHPKDAERIAERVKEKLKDSRLPFEFRRKAGEVARRLERDANMRATDGALRWAATFARAEKMKDRAKSLAEARRYLSRAVMLGADKAFQHAANREIEAIMLSGGVVRQGPSRAKPQSFAPKNPNSAKC